MLLFLIKHLLCSIWQFNYILEAQHTKLHEAQTTVPAGPQTRTAQAEGPTFPTPAPCKPHQPCESPPLASWASPGLREVLHAPPDDRWFGRSAITESWPQTFYDIDPSPSQSFTNLSYL